MLAVGIEVGDVDEPQLDQGVNWNRIVVGAIAVLALVVVYDALQRDDEP